jgi:signal recognition particle receptor subunit beta
MDYLPVILAVLVGALGLFLYWLLVARKKKSTKKDLVLLVGPCGGGKTVLAYRLQSDKVVLTVTSIKPHTVQLKADSAKDGAGVSLVDFPGHPRLKSQLASDYLPRAKKVVFVLDAVSTMSKLREAAELMYDMFTDPCFENNGPPVLVACNKCDAPGALPALRLKLKLQEEVEKIRKTRQSVQESNEAGSRVVLGREGQPFSIDRDAPVEVTFEAVSAQAGTKLDVIKTFIGVGA